MPKNSVEFSLDAMRDEPATEHQKVKLKFFGIAFSAKLTKAAASELLDKIDDPVREKEYRAYRDALDTQQEATDDLNLRIDTWRSSLEMRDDDYRSISDAQIADVLNYLDDVSPDWEQKQPLVFYDALAQRHPDVLR
jgi:hypothetical protein